MENSTLTTRAHIDAVLNGGAPPSGGHPGGPQPGYPNDSSGASANQGITATPPPN